MRDKEVSEETRAESDERDRDYLAAVLDALTSGVIVTDERFVIRWFSRRATELVPGLSSGIGMYELLEPTIHEQKIDRFLLRRERITTTYGDGREPVEWIRSRQLTASGEHVLLVWPAHLTDRLVEQRADFTMAAFHELRTPLTTLIGFTEILEAETEAMSPGQREAVEMIGRAARRLSGLTDDIFDLAQNSFGELRLAIAEVDLARIVSQSVEIHTPRALEKGQGIRFSPPPGLPFIEADPARIQQVVNNLIDNACVHNRPGTVIEVSLERVEDGLELVVADDGDGLGFDPPAQAFNTFYRPDVSIEAGHPGSGIGLPLAKRLIELHRGRLELEGPPGEGTRVRVWLPLDRASALEIDRPEAG